MEKLSLFGFSLGCFAMTVYGAGVVYSVMLGAFGGLAFGTAMIKCWQNK